MYGLNRLANAGARADALTVTVCSPIVRRAGFVIGTVYSARPPAQLMLWSYTRNPIENSPASASVIRYVTLRSVSVGPDVNDTAWMSVRGSGMVSTNSALSLAARVESKTRYFGCWRTGYSLPR